MDEATSGVRPVRTRMTSRLLSDWLDKVSIGNIERSTKMTTRKQSVAVRTALAAAFTALGVTVAPFTWFLFLGTKAFPGQHFVNSLAGILLGPYWASLVALMVGVMRNILGVGTIFAFPGGVPGALVVGLAYELTKRFRSRYLHYSAALLEPVGTVIIGATMSLFIVAPLIGWRPLLISVERYGVPLALLILWGGWAVSSVSGCFLGYFVVLGLDRVGLLVRRDGA